MSLLLSELTNLSCGFRYSGQLRGEIDSNSSKSTGESLPTGKRPSVLTILVALWVSIVLALLQSSDLLLPWSHIFNDLVSLAVLSLAELCSGLQPGKALE